MKHRGIVVATVALASIALAAAWATEPAPETPPTPAPKLTVPLVPTEAAAMKNPQPATEQSIEFGKRIYSSQCLMCHGAQGAGDGSLAKRLSYRMPDFRSQEMQRSRTDGAMFYVLTEGHGKMTGQGERLSTKVRWDLVNYIRTLGK